MARNNCYHQIILSEKSSSTISSVVASVAIPNSIVFTEDDIQCKTSIITTTDKKRRFSSLKRRNDLVIGNLTIILFFCSILLLNGLMIVMAECPRLCECKWKSGKESVLCLNANLSNIPLKLDTGTQILDLTGNEITNIAHDIFANSKLLNLQKIFLSKCRLRLIERYAFRNLTNLIELDLSYNQLTSIPSHSFDSIPELREIKLNGNPIQRIFNDAFVRISQLIRLELSDCKISSVEMKAFNGLESTLEWLKLDGNKLVEIRSETLTGLSNLHGLELARNLWNCSCRLRPLRAWMLRENIPYGIPPICRSPGRLSGKSWDKIDLDDFACVPQIMAPDTRAHGVEGRNITMSCFIEGIPEPNIRWIVKNRVIANLTGLNAANNGEAAGLTASSTTSQGRKTYMVNLLKNSSNLTILTADIQDAGIYTCAAENKAGRVEASVTLAVSRKPPEAPLGAKIILICVLVALLFVVGSSFAALCFCSLRRKRRKMRLWRNAPARSDSYEKIEMNRKPDNGGIGIASGSCSRAFGGIRIDENRFTADSRLHNAENGIAIVQPIKKNGDYRNVPTDDDGTGYEDNNILDSSFSLSRRHIENNNQQSRWKGSNRIKSPKELARKAGGGNIEETDLHIPRLIDLSSNTDSASSSVSSQVDAATLRLTKSSTSTAPSSIYTHSKTASISPWTNQLISNKKPSPLVSIENNNSPNKYGKDDVNSSIFCSSQTPDDPLCDLDRTYPDLLDVYKYSNSSLPTNSFTSNNNAFCTLPRKFKNSTKHFRTTSDSQSPLLPECSSKYGSSILGDISFTDFAGRRFSAESYVNYPGMQTTVSHQRSNSFLSLVQTSNKMSSGNRRNPSLPSSPVRGDSSRAFSSAATPLLDFSSFMSNQSPIVPSTSTTVNAYDYHAAQLERFLEEYRNLQDQLCKMKETCESIRKKEAPLRGALGGHSAAQFADPLMFNAAIAETNLNVEPQIPTKTLLKNKSVPGKKPEPPPYWLHRNAMLKRLNDSQSEFFQS